MNSEDKVFAGITAVFLVIFTIAIVGMTGSLLVAMWKAGFVNFVIWNAVFVGLFFSTKAVYRLILRKGWYA